MQQQKHAAKDRAAVASSLWCQCIRLIWHAITICPNGTDLLDAQIQLEVNHCKEKTNWFDRSARVKTKSANVIWIGEWLERVLQFFRPCWRRIRRYGGGDNEGSDDALDCSGLQQLKWPGTIVQNYGIYLWASFGECVHMTRSPVNCDECT